MPESEPKPRLIELLTPGAGQGWKAVLKNGHPVVVHEIPVPAAEAAAAVPRIQRLAEHRHPALSPVLAWGTDPNGIWVAVEPNEGTPLSTILTRGPLSPPAAAALGTAVLSGVAALHEAGIAMGGFAATAVRVTGNGEVRLAGHPAAAVRGAPAQSDLRADVRSSGMAVCAAFGVDPAGAPAPPNIPPGLVVTMRSMASGAMGPAADRAQGALREMASALLAPDRMMAAQSELAVRSGGRESPGVTPFLPKTEAPAPAPPLPYVPAVPREDTPLRAPVSYEAPPRPMQTYPSIPAPTYAPPAPPAAPAPPPLAPEPRAVPTWSEAPPRTPTPVEAPVAPAAMTPPAPMPTTTNPPEPAGEAAAEWVPPAPTPSTPAGTRSPFETVVPTPAMSTNPPASAPPAPPAPPAAPAQQTPSQTSTWMPVEAPVWTPGKVETPAEPPAWVPGGLGAAAPAAATAAADSTAAAPVAPAPAPLRAPAPTPARKPSVARKPAGGGPSGRPAWLIPAIIAVVLILLLGTVGGIALTHRSGSSNGTATASPSPKASNKASPSPTPTSPEIKGVPPGPPFAAAPITSAQFCTVATPCHGPGMGDATDTHCDLSGPCSFDVGIYYAYPPGYGGPVSFSLVFFDRCSGVTTNLPGTFHTTAGNAGAPKFADSELGGQATLPSGAKAAYLIAVTSAPAIVQSPALKLGADTCA